MATTTETYNDDELTPPEFLTIEFLTEVIKHCEADENIVVTDLKLTPGTAKGDHYASVMFRAVIEYKQKGETKKKSMIIKTTPDADGVKKDMLEQTTVFEVEIGMYTKVLDKFEEILRSIGDDTVLKAKCLYHSLSPKKVIIFEDLVTLGYEVVRKRPLDINELKAVYSKLAKWHALSCKIGFEV
ncbi:uncharacterized protein LOC119675689 [Teleopsis dalmanni]|uniref:uncharacterized protein LOC119675689 n=1 Tax=Teleopsis dalmanni TaxID=139649 RepID=UPI0018CDEB6D|nr:uncharacterized protein LOC119675689 [Teleopsis dalmanni]